MNRRPYLLLHCAELWVQGFKVVSETTLSVHGGLKVSQCHLAQPLKEHTHTHKDNIFENVIYLSECESFLSVPKNDADRSNSTLL